MTRTDETWIRLVNWTGGQTNAERLAGLVLVRLGYRELDPSHPLGGPDGAADALATRDGKTWVVAVYFPHTRTSFGAIKSKFLEDLPGVRLNDADGIVFVVGQPLTRGERKDLRELVLDASVDIVHVERLQNVLDSPEMSEIRRQYLGVSFEDPGAAVIEVSRLVAESTDYLSRRGEEAADRVIASIRSLTVDPSSIDATITRMPTILEPLVREAVRASPRLADALRAAMDSTNPGTQLLDLLERPPIWLATAAQSVWEAIGEVSLYFVDDSTGATAVICSVIEAVEIDVRQYWIARLQIYRLEHPHIEVDSSVLPLLASGSSHPLGMAAEQIGMNNCSDATRILDDWQPSSKIEDQLKTLLLVKAHLAGGGRESVAIGLLREGWRRFQSAATAMPLARLIIYRAQVRRTDNLDQDLDEALGLAKEARDLIRRYRGRSQQAVLIAVDACMARHDWYGVWRLTRPAPDGEATEDEANSPEVLAHAALCAAVTGRTSAARALSATSTGFHRAWIDAACAESDLRHSANDNADPPSSSTLVTLWDAALALASNDIDKLVAIRGLVANGVALREDWNDLLAANPDMAAELAQLAEVAETESDLGPTKKARLRALARTNRYAALRLAETLATEGDALAGSQVLAAAADQNADQNLRLLAAQMLNESGFNAEANEMIERALATSSPTWPGRARAWQELHRKASESGDWLAAMRYASEILGLNPADDTARWALAVACVNASEHEMAWDTLTRTDVTPDPPSTNLALLMLKLKARFGNIGDLVRDCVALASRNRDDEEVLSAILQIAHIALGRPLKAAVVNVGAVEESMDGEDANSADADRIDSDLVEALKAITEDFFDRFPESRTGFRRVSANPDNLLEVLEEMRIGLKVQAATVADFASQNYPAGAMSAALHQSYSELLFRRQDGAIRLRSEDGSVRGQESDTILNVLRESTPIMIEASAIRTLVLLAEVRELRIAEGSVRDSALPAPLLQRVIGSFPNGMQITDDALRDLVAARDALSIASEVGVYLDAADQEVRIGADAAGTRTRAAWSQAAVNIARSFRLVPSRAIDPRALRAGFAEWLGVLETARYSGLPLWSDDSRLRQVASSVGVPSFGTFEVFEALRDDGTLSGSEFDGLRAALLLCGTVDLDPSIGDLMHAAHAQGWHPGAVALILGAAPSWRRSPTDCFRILSEALARSVNNVPSIVGWFHQACTGLAAAILPDYRQVAIAELFASSALQSFVSPLMVSAMLSGLRGAVPAISESVWRAALKAMHSSYLESNEEDSAAQLLLLGVQGCPEEFRMVAMQVIFGSRNG